VSATPIAASLTPREMPETLQINRFVGKNPGTEMKASIAAPRPRTTGLPVLDLLGRVLPLRIGPICLLVMLIQAVYFVIIHVASDRALTLNVENVLLLLYSFVTLTVLVQLVSSITAWSRAARIAGNLLLVFVYINLFGYHATTRASLDYSVAADNIPNAWSLEGGIFVVRSCGLPAMLTSAVVMGVLGLLEARWRVLSSTVQRRPLWPKVLTSAAIYAAILVAPITTYDDVTYFWQSAIDYYRPGSRNRVELEPETYPLVKNRGHGVKAALEGRRGALPPIILLTIESFNESFVERRDDSGREYTPVFNRKIKEGLYVERFYGNSIQTCKGLFAILFSAVPSFRGKAFRDYPRLEARSLPALLREAGYDTVFFQAYDDLEFDRTRPFLTRHGFSAVKTVHDHLKPEDQELVWGWGPEDGLFYRRVLEHLDRSHAKRDKPLFLHLTTINNHLDFNDVPLSKRAFHKKPRNRAQAYANSIHLADRHLGEFFAHVARRDYLKDALIIITGDHAMPMGRHGTTFNEVGYHDDSFRTPVLMLWEGRLKPRRITERAHSQMDIAPTVLDLLGLESVEHHFQGVSMLRHGEEQHPIYLVQPYSGRYLIVVRFPHKLIVHDRTGHEILYDLRRDPEEQNDRIGDAPVGLLTQLRTDLRAVYLNQRLLETNALWPSSH
jgi:hypothetical protein